MFLIFGLFGSALLPKVIKMTKPRGAQLHKNMLNASGACEDFRDSNA